MMRVAIPEGSALAGEITADPERLLSTAEVARLLGIQPATWRNYVRRGYAPTADVPSASLPLWRLETVREYRQGRKRRVWKKQ